MLNAWADKNRAALGLSRELEIETQGFHATYRVKPNGELVVEAVAQFAQMLETTGDPRFGGLPFRGGTTVVASADGTVRFVIAKPLTPAREARQLEFVNRSDLTDPGLPWADSRYLGRRVKRDLRSLHRGLF